MVVRATAEGWCLVRQGDHARLAGELAEDWDFPGLPGERDPEYLAAVQQHDAGWAAWDDAPRFHPSGEPVTFFQLPVPEFLSLWESSISTCAALGPLAGYVVSRHFCRLAEANMPRHDPPHRVALERFLASQKEAQLGWRSAVGPKACRLEQLTDLLQVCDLLSLMLIIGGGSSQLNNQSLNRLGIRAWLAGETAHFEPYPFRQRPIEAQVPASFLARGSSARDVALHFLLL